jgi:biopolymer transport protein ExbD
MRGLSHRTRRIARRLRRKEEGELNLVSMIDILTVLVFFLLVNATGVSLLGINLPDSASKPLPNQPQHALKIVIRPDSFGVFDMNTEVQTLPHARRPEDYLALAQIMGGIKDQIPDESKITLLLEDGVPYNVLVQTMDVVRQSVSKDGKERELFPNISLGDAPAAANAASPNTGAKP